MRLTPRSIAGLCTQFQFKISLSLLRLMRSSAFTANLSRDGPAKHPAEGSGKENPVPTCNLDHLVVAAQTLQQGVSYLEEQLGVTVPVGGAHPLMGTHNRLMRLGSGVFLEIIAIDPDASPPDRPRWYALDEPVMQDRLATRPRLITWVVRADDILSAVESSAISPGPVIEGRRGDLVWQITVPEDGSMPEGGLFPTLIQWPGKLNEHGPAPKMADLGCSLSKLTVYSPEPSRLSQALQSIGAAGLVEVATGSPTLVAVIDCPKGLVTLS